MSVRLGYGGRLLIVRKPDVTGAASPLFHRHRRFYLNFDLRRMQQCIVNQAVMHRFLNPVPMFLVQLDR